MDTDRIGIHHKIATGVTTSQRKQSEFLLDKTKDQAQCHSDNRTINEIIRPSNKKIRVINLSLAPKLRNVATSAFLSIISMDNEPITLKQAIIRIKVRKI